MARHKLKEEDKKKDITVTVDMKLNEKLEKYLTEKGISNKSRYIERLIKNDMIERGEDLKDIL